MGLFDSLPPPSRAPADQTAADAVQQPAGGLFGSLPPPSTTPADPAAGKRPAEDSNAAEPAADSSSKRARSDASELASAGSGPLASAGSGGSLGAPQQRCTRLEAAYSEDAGSRLTMEDVAVISLDALAGAGGAPGASARLSFFGVFDGHGGRNVAQLAAEQLNPCCLVAGLQQEAARVAAAAGGAQAGAAGGGEPAAAQQAAAQQQPSAKACKAAIVEGFRELDRRVLERCAAANWPDGCTAVAAWVIGELVLVANVGDARCVLARCPLPAAAPAGGEGQPAAGAAAAVGVGQGRQQLAQQAQQEQAAQAALEPLKAVVLTREHKAIFPGERQRIERAGSFVSGDGRLAGRIEVSRALGDRQFKRAGMSAVPDIQAFSLTSRDRFLLLACDGFWGVFTPQDAVSFTQRELAAKGNGVKQTCNRLIHEAIRERRCKDNCTVMLVLVDHEGSA